MVDRRESPCGVRSSAFLIGLADHSTRRGPADTLARAPTGAYTPDTVTPEARRAITVIRECVETDRYAVAVHFSRRMQQRGLFWADVQSVIDDPGDV